MSEFLDMLQLAGLYNLCDIPPMSKIVIYSSGKQCL